MWSGIKRWVTESGNQVYRQITRDTDMVTRDTDMSSRDTEVDDQDIEVGDQGYS